MSGHDAVEGSERKSRISLAALRRGAHRRRGEGPRVGRLRAYLLERVFLTEVHLSDKPVPPG